VIESAFSNGLHHAKTTLSVRHEKVRRTSG
jgi:hypothetical protein